MHSLSPSGKEKSGDQSSENPILNDFFALGVRYVLQNEIGNSKEEGGFTCGDACDPDDKGKATKWGISTVTLSAWRGVHVSPETMKALTLDEAQQIYRKLFWEPLKCHKLKRAAIAISLFDAGVLYGHHFAVECAQAAAKEVGCLSLKIDGHIGPATIGALNAVTVKSWIPAFIQQLHSHIENLVTLRPKNEKFEQGWKNRADRLKTFV